jgi:hypothetical protein
LLECASDGVPASVRIAGHVASGVVMGLGTVVAVSAIGTGVLLCAARAVLAFIPNQLGRALLDNKRIPAAPSALAPFPRATPAAWQSPLRGVADGNPLLRRALVRRCMVHFMRSTFFHSISAIAAAAAALLLAAPAAHAGRPCENKPLTASSITQAMSLAQRTSAALDAESERSGARVVVLARAGQDLSQYGLRYSHLGWAYKTPQGPWRVLHKLNRCGTDTAALYRQGLGEFFLDDLWRFESAWAVPAPTLQAPLYALLNHPQRSVRINARPYSMVSSPWSTRYQPSNQWVLEMLASAAEPGIQSREQAQAWRQFKGHQSSALRIGALTRLGARLGSANIALDDHPNAKRFADRIETGTVDSMFQWLQRTGLALAPQALSL